MTTTLKEKSYVFHTDMGSVVTRLAVVDRYDVEDIIKDRAVSQARSIQFYNQAQRSSVNDPKAPRTISSIFTKTAEELPT